MSTSNINKVIERLEKNNMSAYFAGDREQLFCILSELIPDGCTVGHGGSVTLDECGVFDWLRQRDICFYDRDRSDDIDECMRKSMTADVFVCSTNAVTEQGELYNVDGRGNRVSAMIYGPASVIVIAGANKIVPDISHAVKRIERMAAPMNAARLHTNTPCAMTGECAHCSCADRICCNYVVMSHQRKPGRIKVILLDEKLGY